MERMAKGMDTTTAGLLAKLKKQGISEEAFRRYVTALVGFNRLISGKYRNDLEVDPKAVDARNSRRSSASMPTTQRRS